MWFVDTNVSLHFWTQHFFRFLFSRKKGKKAVEKSRPPFHHTNSNYGFGWFDDDTFLLSLIKVELLYLLKIKRLNWPFLIAHSLYFHSVYTSIENCSHLTWKRSHAATRKEKQRKLLYHNIYWRSNNKLNFNFISNWMRKLVKENYFKNRIFDAKGEERRGASLFRSIHIFSIFK